MLYLSIVSHLAPASQSWSVEMHDEGFADMWRSNIDEIRQLPS
jgi:hypothetical protein